MSCPCQIDGGGYPGSGDIAKFIDVRHPKARKMHVCDECNRKIEKGEKYERICGLWDVEFSTWKTCVDCLSVRKNLFCSWIYGEIWEEVSEAIEGLPPAECMMALTKLARDKVCDLVEEQWEVKK